MKISIIGGGNMGGAIAYGAVAGGISYPSEIAISHLSCKMQTLLDLYLQQITTTKDNREVIKGSQIIVIAVKPWLLEQVMGEIAELIDRTNQIVISVVAAVSHETIEGYLDSERLGRVATYRVIPNTAISIKEGVTHICSSNTTAEQDAAVRSLFDAMGRTFMVEEHLMEPLTALSSCGIAYAFKYIDASIKAGVEMGVAPRLALESVLQTVAGAVKMLEGEGTMPQEEIDKVTTEGGLTFRGLDAMERGGFTAAVIDGLKCSK